jgi:hypothetical protein
MVEISKQRIERMKKLRESIKDEMCKCGHLLSQHKDTLCEKGHGHCNFFKPVYDEETDRSKNEGVCGCEKFRWDSFIYKDNIGENNK